MAVEQLQQQVAYFAPASNGRHHNQDDEQDSGPPPAIKPICPCPVQLLIEASAQSNVGVIAFRPNLGHLQVLGIHFCSCVEGSGGADNLTGRLAEPIASKLIPSKSECQVSL